MVSMRNLTSRSSLLNSVSLPAAAWLDSAGLVLPAILFICCQKLRTSSSSEPLGSLSSFDFSSFALLPSLELLEKVSCIKRINSSEFFITSFGSAEEASDSSTRLFSTSLVLGVETELALPFPLETTSSTAFPISRPALPISAATVLADSATAPNPSPTP